jgi:hypothetical protein
MKEHGGIGLWNFSISFVSRKVNVCSCALLCCKVVLIFFSYVYWSVWSTDGASSQISLHISTR